MSIFGKSGSQLIILCFFVVFTLSQSRAFANPDNISDIETPHFKDTYDVSESLGIPSSSARITFDNYAGHLNFSFSIPLFNLAPGLRDKLVFHYNSSEMQNDGFGLGFSLDLPRIYPKRSTLRSGHYFNSGSSVIEIDKKGNKFVETELKHFADYKIKNDSIHVTYPSGKKIILDKQTGRIREERTA